MRRRKREVRGDGPSLIVCGAVVRHMDTYTPLLSPSASANQKVYSIECLPGQSSGFVEGNTSSVLKSYPSTRQPRQAHRRPQSCPFARRPSVRAISTSTLIVRDQHIGPHRAHLQFGPHHLQLHCRSYLAYLHSGHHRAHLQLGLIMPICTAGLILTICTLGIIEPICTLALIEPICNLDSIMPICIAGLIIPIRVSGLICTPGFIVPRVLLYLFTLPASLYGFAFQASFVLRASCPRSYRACTLRASLCGFAFQTSFALRAPRAPGLITPVYAPGRIVPRIPPCPSTLRASSCGFAFQATFVLWARCTLGLIVPVYAPGLIMPICFSRAHLHAGHSRVHLHAGRFFC